METNWLEVTLQTTGEELEALAARLTANGITGLVIEDEEDFRNFLEQNRQYWGYVDDALLERMRGAACIKFYVTDDTAGRAQMAAWLTGVEGVEISTIPLKEDDWATSWQKYYHPMAAGERLYIVPQWERAAPIPAGRVPLYLNPGLTFGTGSHSSTRLCLADVERYIVPDGRILDLGCGSGILSIAALLLGARTAVGVDIDPKAVDVAYENAELNGIGRSRYTVRAGDVLTDRALADELARETYQLVVANIVADVIIPLSAHAGDLLAPGGVFLCSGIIDTRADEVKAALEQNGLAVLDTHAENGWVAYAAERRG